MSNDENRTPVGDDALGWPGQDTRSEADQGGMSSGRPTSPARSAASAAAARAAYANAGKGAPRAEQHDLSQDDAPSIEEEPVIEPADPREDIIGSEQDPEPESAEGRPEAPGPDTQNVDARLAAERLADYQRLNAEYVNYKRRVDRDRAGDRKRAVASFLESLLPVLDEIHLAREHGELVEGTPFAKIAAKLEGILAKQGVSAFGEVGETFDPMVHEALMHTTAELPEGTTDTTVVMVMQPGYRIDDRVVRPARVSVADPA
ncbi:nucleotide exchange factor GrpE [Mobilicoccus caccae]|uniref:Protein GrpE n=1 Tax=Mobilicoccus caccae TaxID=1859295 RepID=A0ABQ6IN29_9MICO|nr:nucleotide exchange factor GrpE [Mobilicoccus caccae]GMA38118.1 hypothetical protein GCM10025883_01630 [Mobilicoccus caccae]